MMRRQIVSCSGFTMVTGLPLYPSWDETLGKGTISEKQVKVFYEFDRCLFTILVMELWRDPVASMHVLAFWLWLERTCCSHAIKRILSLPSFLIRELADEAVTCLNRLLANSSILSFSDPCDMPLTQSLVGSGISLLFFNGNEKHLNPIDAVYKIGNDVCVRALDDIMLRAIERNNARAISAENQMALRSLADQGLNELGFVDPDPLRVGGRNIINRRRVPFNRPPPPPPPVHPDERTIFATFSMGYPVSEDEIYQLFSSLHGDCIESLHMEEVPPDEQPLFARVVFYSPLTVMMTLKGPDKAKLVVNGKHIWLRKYVRRYRRYIAPRRRSRPRLRASLVWRPLVSEAEPRASLALFQAPGLVLAAVVALVFSSYVLLVFMLASLVMKVVA